MSSSFTLPTGTPLTNVLRFLLLEYFFLKALAHVVEGTAAVVAAKRQRNEQRVRYREGWGNFFLLPYRLQESHWTSIAFLTLSVIALNAFLVLFEFGFDSEVLPAGEVVSLQEVRSEGVGGLSRPLPSEFNDLRWIDRLQQLHDGCVVRNGYWFTLRNGYIQDSPVLEKLDSIHLNAVKCESATVQMDLSADDYVLGQDDMFGLDITPQQVRFRMSFAGLSVTAEPFLDSILDVKLVQFERTAFPRMEAAGGQYDMRVEGQLHLRKLASSVPPGNSDWLVRFSNNDAPYHDRLKNSTSRYYPPSFFRTSDDFYSFDVVGSCTGDDVSNYTYSTVAAPADERVTCVLSDSDANRFILPAKLFRGDVPRGYIPAEVGLNADAWAGQRLYLIATAGVFRANIVNRLEVARDKDHLAAAKSYRLNTRGVDDSMYETAISSFFPPAVRTFSAVLVYGATDLTVAKVKEATDERERATVELWTIVLTAVAFGGLALLGVCLSCCDYSRKNEVGADNGNNNRDDDHKGNNSRREVGNILRSFRQVRDEGPMPPVTYNYLLSLLDTGNKFADRSRAEVSEVALAPPHPRDHQQGDDARRQEADQKKSLDKNTTRRIVVDDDEDVHSM